MNKNTETFTIDVSYMSDEEYKKLLKKIKQCFKNHEENVCNRFRNESKLFVQSI